MFCHRKRGQRAILHKLERLGENGEKARRATRARSPRSPSQPEEKGEKRASATARGLVVELGENAIVVQDAESGRRLACRVPDGEGTQARGRQARRPRRDPLRQQRARLPQARGPQAEESKLYGAISALSSTSVSVTGEGRTLTCSVPAAFAEKLGRFAVGMNVKMMCRGGELTYLEKV